MYIFPEREREHCASGIKMVVIPRGQDDLCVWNPGKQRGEFSYLTQDGRSVKQVSGDQKKVGLFFLLNS